MAFLLTVERFAGLNGGVAYTAQHRDQNSLREKLGMVALAVAVAAGCVIEREEKVSKIEHGMEDNCLRTVTVYHHSGHVFTDSIRTCPWQA